MSSTSSVSSLVTVHVEDLLRFFDEKPDWSIKRATSVVGIAGEELNAACFQYYVKSIGGNACVLPNPVTTGKRNGYRLDRWIQAVWPDGSVSVFQTEIKNWSAHAIGGRIIPISATVDELRESKVALWKRHWDEGKRSLQWSGTWKVLTRMKVPEGIDKCTVRPLLIFWEALAPKDDVDKHLFTVNVANDAPGDFKELWVFSVSSYLRSLHVPTLDLDMPETASRIGVLRRLFG